MRSTGQVFHLAIPCNNLSLAKHFYERGLGCKVAREYEDRITIDFFGDQIVCHYAPESIDTELNMYPRHFGITFTDKDDFEAVLIRAKDNNLHFFSDPFTRFEGKKEQHSTFFLVDPSNNLIEFKHYNDPKMIY